MLTAIVKGPVDDNDDNNYIKWDNNNDGDDNNGGGGDADDDNDDTYLPRHHAKITQLYISRVYFYLWNNN